MENMNQIPFNKPFIIGKELDYIAQAVMKGHLSGDGSFTLKCHNWIEQHYGVDRALLTHSCTAALEMAAILANIGPGDEVIMPSYTFVSTANAFVLRGAIPVWCDIRPDTLNMDESKIESLITEKTKAIVPVHYAGVGCEMDTIMKIAKKHDLIVIEDAAQGVNALYKERFLGTIGHLGTYSFHETKNYISGEGGALLINDPRFTERAEIIRQKGTNRNQFFRGEVDKYTWVDIGSSYLPSELVAAFLFAQLEDAEKINNKRLSVWLQYHEGLKPLAEAEMIQLPIIPDHCNHNAHMFFIILPDEEIRSGLIEFMKVRGVSAVFHYVPLHTSPMGKKAQRNIPDLPVTDELSVRLLRLPCFYELTDADTLKVIGIIHEFMNEKG